MVHEIYIRTTPEALWQAITDPEFTRRYWFDALNRSDWAPGARLPAGAHLSRRSRERRGGWEHILSGLQTLLETGQPAKDG